MTRIQQNLTRGGGALGWGLMAFGAIAFAAEKPIKNKDWTYSKKILAGEDREVCVAETQKKDGETIFTLSFVVDPISKAPPAIYFGSGLGDIGAAVSLQTDSSRTLFRHLRAQRDDVRLGTAAYYFAPDKFSSFYSQIRRDSAVKFSYPLADGKTKTLYFSLLGSTATLDALSKNCDPTWADRAKLFFDSLDKVVPGTVSGDRGVDAVQLSLAETWTSYIDSLKLTQQLKSVDDRIKPLAAQEVALLKKKGALTTQLDGLNTQKTAAQNRRQQSVVQLETRQTNLINQEKSLAAARVELKAKEDIYKPVSEGLTPFFSENQSAESEANYYASQKSQYESQLSQANSRIRDLESRESGARSSLANEERNLTGYERELRQAQTNLTSYNVDWEVRQAIARDSTYQSYEENIRRYRAEVTNLQNQYNRATGDLRSAEQDLRRCESRGDRGDRREASVAPSAERPGPGPRPRPDEPGPRPRPGNPGENDGNDGTPRPRPRPEPPDCSREKARVDEASRTVARTENELNRAQANVAESERQLDRRRADIESAVNDRYRALKAAVDAAQDRVADANAKVRSYERLINDINQNLIPRERQVASEARQGIQAVEPRLEQANARWSRAYAALQAEIKRTGYTEKRNAYLAAEQVVNGINAEIRVTESEIRKYQADIAQMDKSLVQLQTQIDTVVSNLSKETAGLEELLATLTPLREHRANVLAQAQAQAQDFSAKSVLYRTILRNTLEIEAPRPAAAPTTAFYDWVR